MTSPVGDAIPWSRTGVSFGNRCCCCCSWNRGELYSSIWYRGSRAPALSARPQYRRSVHSALVAWGSPWTSLVESLSVSKLKKELFSILTYEQLINSTVPDNLLLRLFWESLNFNDICDVLIYFFRSSYMGRIDNVLLFEIPVFLLHFHLKFFEGLGN